MGTRGIPNRYGGFEQVASSLSYELVQRGHAVSVYNAHNHSYQEKRWKGVTIIHCYDPENLLGTAGQFVYDLNCVLHARKQQYDIILMLGYTSSSVWGWLYPSGASIIFNMDGWEWKRSKYATPVRKFLLYAEKLAVKYADRLVADSPAIKAYLDNKYPVQSHHITYGAAIMEEENISVLAAYGLEKNGYDMLMARIEPENNIEPILEGVCNSHQRRRIVVVGNTATRFGQKMFRKFGHHPRVQFIGGSFDQVAVHSLRKYCHIYFHGHSVGGTNPSLLEAMASGTLICAHDNPFNRVILENDAYYFHTAQDITEICNRASLDKSMVHHNTAKISITHNWKKVTDSYEQLFMDCKRSVQ